MTAVVKKKQKQNSYTLVILIRMFALSRFPFLYETAVQKCVLVLCRPDMIYDSRLDRYINTLILMGNLSAFGLIPLRKKHTSADYHYLGVYFTLLKAVCYITIGKDGF